MPIITLLDMDIINSFLEGRILYALIIPKVGFLFPHYSLINGTIFMRT
jgi:hypothetical protein